MVDEILEDYYEEVVITYERDTGVFGVFWVRCNCVL